MSERKLIKRTITEEVYEEPDADLDGAEGEDDPEAPEPEGDPRPAPRGRRDPRR